MKTHKLSAEEIIRKEYGNSPNFMTPEVLKYGMASATVAWELSKGTGMSGQPIFGVSVVRYDASTGSTKRLSDLSGLRQTLSGAEELIRALHTMAK